MRIPVSNLVGRPGAIRHVALIIDRDELDPPSGAWGPADEALASALDLDLRLEMLVEGLFARGTVSFTTTVPCARCLTEVETACVVPVAELFLDPRRLEAGDEIEPGYELLVPEGVIDIEALLRDAIGTTLDIRQLCTEACQGLCPVCGADLNVRRCGHAFEPSPDPRWAALQRLDLPPG